MSFFSELGSNVLALIVFSIVILVVYYLIPRQVRKSYLLLTSIAFYGLCDLKMLAVLLASIVFTWYCTNMIQKSNSKKWLFFGCTVLILLLAFFKYNNFFVNSVNAILDCFGIRDNSGILKLALPLGISYYVFKSISYMVDVYKKKYEAEKNLLNYGFYISFYPEIISGPISRYDEFKKAMDTSMNYSVKNMETGFYLIIRGLFMKGVIANRLADYVGGVFSAPESFGGIALWLAAFFYAVQLYCDFAGYSSIAIGITQLFGLHYKDNFIRPYFSTNIVEFWNRWHISLSSWLKEYIYIPLGGSRCSKLRKKLNVMIVFLVSGLWHGTGLNFVVWGLYHGILNAFTPRKKEAPKGIKKFILIIVNFALVTFGWIPFGSQTLGKAAVYIKRMFLNLSISMVDIQRAILPFTSDNTCIAFFLTVILFTGILIIREWYEEKKNIKSSEPASLLWQVFLLTSILLFGNFASSGFIYANF